MSRFANQRSVSHGVAGITAGIVAVASIVAAIGVAIAGSSPTRAPLEAVFRLEAFGCKRNPTRTVGTVVSSAMAGGGQLIITVAHGVVGQDVVELVNGTSRVSTRLVAVDTDLDLAVLQVASVLTGPDEMPLTGVRMAEGREGNANFVVFAEPTGDASEYAEIAVVRPARVVRRLRIRTEDVYLREVKSGAARPGLEVAVAASVGDSGGPLFDPNGSLIGLVWGTSRKSGARSWATRVQAATPLIAAATESVKRRDIASAESLGLLACPP